MTGTPCLYAKTRTFVLHFIYCSMFTKEGKKSVEMIDANGVKRRTPVQEESWREAWVGKGENLGTKCRSGTQLPKAAQHTKPIV